MRYGSTADSKVMRPVCVILCRPVHDLGKTDPFQREESMPDRGNWDNFFAEPRRNGRCARDGAQSDAIGATL